MKIALDVLPFAVETNRTAFIAFDFPDLTRIATSSTSPFGLWGSRLLLSRHLARYSGSDLDVAPRLEDDTGSWVAAHSSLKICDLEKREI